MTGQNDGMIDEEMAKKLAEYETASNDNWRSNDAMRKAKQALDKMCGREQRRLTRAVNVIMRNARPGWTVHETKCYVSIDHSKHPMHCHVLNRVALGYCVERQRGEIRMYADMSERKELLDELRAVVTGGD